MSEAAVLLEVRGLGRRFEPRAGRGEVVFAIRDLSFDVREGEFLTIVGPSGSGKSTLLNLIAQIDAPTEGEIRFRGRPIAGATAGALRPGWDRQFGYVTQDDTLLPWRTLIENVLFPLRVQGRLSGQTRDHASTLMRTVGLAGFERYYPHELSGGMRKRAQLAQSLVADPTVLLMDEPFSALDVQTRNLMENELLEVWSGGAAGGAPRTVLFITHDLEEAIALSDEIVVMTAGPGTIKARYEVALPRPRNVAEIRFAPRFVALYEQAWNDLRDEVARSYARSLEAG